MNLKKKILTMIAGAVLLASTLFMPTVAAQDMPAAPAQDKIEKAAKKDGMKKAAPTGTPVLWRDPGDLSARNILLGRGGEEMKPDLSSVSFIEDESATGYSPKFRVRDGAGKVWMAKFGREAQPETVAARLVWAVGYVGETNYLAPCVQIKGAPEPRKKVDRCEGKGFANVRFEARPEGHKRLEAWSWQKNPFAGTREMEGLVVLMALINNWDLKDSNNKIVYVPGGEGAEGELHYIISDLGATFGKTGNFITHNRNEPKDYAKSKFVERREGGKVAFGYAGKNRGLLSGITVEEAKWIGDLLAKLTDEQLQDAFRAANYGPADVMLLTAALRGKINELVAL